MIYTATPFLWEQMLDAPLAHRLAPAPTNWSNSSRSTTVRQAMRSVPGAAMPDRDFIDDVAMAIAALPLQVRNALAPCLIGVYFMHGLGSSLSPTWWQERMAN